MAVFVIRTERRPGIVRFVVRWQHSSLHKQVHLGSFRTRTEAELRKQWADRELAAGRVPNRHSIAVGPVQARRVRDAAAEWLEARRVDTRAGTHASLEDRSRVVMDLVGSLRLDEITPRDVQAMILELVDRGEANRTIRGRVSTLRMILDHAGVDPNPVDARSVRKPPNTGKRIVIPTPDEEDLILSRLNPLYAGVVRFIGATGLRISELIALTWDDVDEDAMAVRVVQSKTRSGERWVTSLPDDPFTLPQRGDSDRLFPVRSRNAVGAAITAACKGKPGEESTRPFGPHSWRHLHASRCLRDGMDVVRVAARLGHSSPDITLKQYAHLVAPRKI